MRYGKGSIVSVSRSRFSDGSYDVHASRPAMLTLASDDTTEETYYLLITSQTRHYNAHSDEYFPLDEDIWREVGLDRPSLIKFDKIHKGAVNGNPTGGLPPYLYWAVISDLREYKEKHPDSIFDEIRDKLR